MARMHTRRRGKSKSRKPSGDPHPEIDASPEEVKNRIVELAKKGAKPTEIGIAIKKEFGVLDVRRFLGKKLVRILKEEGVSPKFPQDLMDLMKKAVKMRHHLKRNKRDRHNQVRLSWVESKIRRLVKYYGEKGEIPKDWKYNPEEAEILVK